MMIRMQTQQTFLAVLFLSVVTMSGCDPSVRREGVGGGARSPVHVTLLTEGGLGESEAEAIQNAGPKITEFGTVRGKISVEGALPNFAPLLAQGEPTKDAICSEMAVPNQSAVGENGGLGNVFIYLKRVPNVDVPAPPTEQIDFDQQGCVFIPHAQVVQVGQPILLKNSDPVAHNVNVKGQANTFNSTITPLNAANVNYQFEFAESKPALVICDFHVWMSSYVMPVDHPWATVTNMDGTFEIPNAPATNLEFVIWHEKLGYIERSLSVDVPANGEASPIEITVSADKLAK
ncbi:cupredoxin domain-containing protein [Thalassoglobus polymorphus]|uniref:Uncharacterized protein n=1 Tax=Thalassoglobus polymorphus TaxID=2527994 RepID=A0A517QRV6_9PLAN|nr:hypothetical protein [Thalassoglobus polymorphus]QDT34348.1 hypothetical protein Mal48_36080 [Thalassoglobus polymorphus]